MSKIVGTGNTGMVVIKVGTGNADVVLAMLTLSKY